MTNLNILINAQDKASAVLRKIQGVAEKTMTGIKKTAQIASKAIAGIALASGGLVIASIKSASTIQDLETQLTTVFDGNMKKVDEAKKNIIDFAKKTPFQVGEVTQAFITLSNMGLNASNEALTSFGDTASAMGKPYQQMIEAVADATTMEFERLKEFGIKTKQNKDTVEFTFKGITTTVAKNSKEIENYLIELGQMNFAGGMERQSKTLSGAWSTLQDNISISSATFAESTGLLDLTTIAVQRLSGWIETIDIEGFGEKINKYVVDNFHKIVGIVGTATEVLKDAFNILQNGEFTNVSGLGEDHPLINFFFTLREKLQEFITFAQEQILIIKDIYNILVFGDFTNESEIGEDHPLVNFFFTLREKMQEFIVIAQDFAVKMQEWWAILKPIVSEIVTEFINMWIERFKFLYEEVFPFFIEQGKILAEWFEKDLGPALKEAFDIIMPELKKFNDALMNLVRAVWPVLQPVLSLMLAFFMWILPPAITGLAKVFAFLLRGVTAFINFFAWSLNDMMRQVDIFVSFVRKVGDVVGSMFSNFPKFIGDAFKGGINLIIRYVNGRIDTFNQLLETARKLPGFGWLPNMWKLEEFARGGIVGDSNMQLVGEKGPELVQMPTGSKVTTADNTSKLLNSGNNQTINLTINVNGGNNTDDDIRKMKDALVRQLLPILKKQL